MVRDSKHTWLDNKLKLVYVPRLNFIGNAIFISFWRISGDQFSEKACDEELESNDGQQNTKIKEWPFRNSVYLIDDLHNGKV